MECKDYKSRRHKWNHRDHTIGTIKEMKGQSWNKEKLPHWSEEVTEGQETKLQEEKQNTVFSKRDINIK